MPSKKGRKKGKKGKKPKQRMRKFDLDLFGLLTFTRYHGAPFEDFMYTPEKRHKPKAPAAGKGKRNKKKKKPVEIPKLMKFPPVPENPAKIRKLRLEKKKKESPDAIITTMNLGYAEKTVRPRLPLQEGGSIRDVICKKVFPLIPRPQPHGGVYANIKCVLCASEGGLLKTVFGLLHKKMRKLLEKQFAKAKFIIEWTTTKFEDMIKNYTKHIEGIFEEMGPVLENLDESEYEDHQNYIAWREDFRKKQKELASLRLQLKRLKKRQEDVLNEALAEKVAEMLAAEREMLAIEKRVTDAQNMLDDWEKNRASKIDGPKNEIQRIKDLLQKIKNSILAERDYLRAILDWEMKIATEKTIAKMEEMITSDIDFVQENLHTAWYRVFLENRRMKEERNRISVDNHLLTLEVEALTRHVGQMSKYKSDIVKSRTHFITPPNLSQQVDRFFNTGAKAVLLQLPSTKYIHE